MRGVRLSTSDWEMRGVIARTFVDRLFGIWRAPVGAAVVIPTRSVHTMGRRRPIQVVGLDARMRVTRVATLRPNRLVVMPGTRMIIELPEGAPAPTRGDKVEVE